jgi:hypothetical protein
MGVIAVSRRAFHVFNSLAISLIAGVMGQWRHQIAVEPRENNIAFAQLAEHPGLGFKKRPLAEAEEDAGDDAGSRLYKYACRRDDPHDQKMPLPRGVL